MIPIHCRNHPDTTPCAVKMSQEAANIVAEAKTDKAAGRIAIDAIRSILEFTGVKNQGNDFPSVVHAIAEEKTMPDA
jgi:hypothetical protein